MNNVFQGELVRLRRMIYTCGEYHDELRYA
jgi:hypothetical protein